MSPATVLVIEDNLDILETVSALLERGGFKVVTAVDCAKATDYLSQNRPDVILTDLMTPEMNGLEFIHHVRRISNLDRVPIVAMSAYDQTYLAAAVGAGAVTALHKPEDLDVLVSTIKQVLAESKNSEAALAGMIVQ
jgi:CheY-like chemotaxis protein